MRAGVLAAAIAAGAAIRIVALPLPGTTDLRVFRVWALQAAEEGIGRLYGTGGRFPDRRLLEAGGVFTKVDYPPLALHELGLAARAGRALAPTASDRAVTTAIKVMVIAAEAGLVLLLFAAGIRGGLRVWLNPASILIGSVLGYLEPLYLLPAMASVLAASRGYGGFAGACLAAACLTKPLGILFAPAVAAALWHSSGARRRVTSALGAGAAVAVLASAPVVVNGGLLNMVWSVGSLLRDPFLTGNALNFWWLAAPLSGAPLDLLRLIGATATAATIAWAIARLPRRADVSLLAAAAAFSVHAYAVMAVSVHENHLYGAVPPLAVAAAFRPAFRGVFAAVSAIAFLNMTVFYGPGVEPGQWLAGTAAILAFGNCAAFAWHASVLSREARRAAIAVDRTEAPA